MKQKPLVGKRSLWVWLATCYPLGEAPFAPGSFGSLLGLAIACGVKWILPEHQGAGAVSSDVGLYTAIVAIVSLLAWWIINRAQPFFAQHDDPRIVIDEVAGQLLTVIYTPLSFQSIVLGFLFFRLFDIVKPWPISYIDKRVPGAFGVLFDDIAAGCAAALLLHFVMQFPIHI